jgi:hypothetical protein
MEDHWKCVTISDALMDADLYTKPSASTPQPSQSDSIDQESILISWDRDWTWIKFPDKPSESVRELMKSAWGARFSGTRQAWYIMEQVAEDTIKLQLAALL